MLSGAAGIAYGHHSIWQFWAPPRDRIGSGHGGPILPWQAALTRPGATQMRHLRALLESHPILGRKPAPELIFESPNNADHLAAARGEGYAFVYSPAGHPITLRPSVLPAGQYRGTWFNPRTGTSESGPTIEGGPGISDHRIACPTEGFGGDWVLILDGG